MDIYLTKKSKELCLFFFLPLESMHDMKTPRKHWQPGAPQTLLNFLAGADVTSACPTMTGNELGEKVLAFSENSENSARLNSSIPECSHDPAGFNCRIL